MPALNQSFAVGPGTRWARERDDFTALCASVGEEGDSLAMALFKGMILHGYYDPQASSPRSLRGKTRRWLPHEEEEEEEEEEEDEEE